MPPLMQPRLCGVLDKPVAGTTPFCACTTCRFDVQSQRCRGRCQLGHVCTRGSNDEVCRCLRELTPPFIGVLALMLAVVIGFSVWALLDSQKNVPPPGSAARAGWDLAKAKGA